MVKSLVIVESPAKAKTISKYLGKGYTVKSSVGHIRDLPKSVTINNNKSKALAADLKSMSEEEKEKYKKEREYNRLIERMGIDPNHNWKANYQILPDKLKVVKELKTIADNCDIIYLATDMDREGEAIAWHLREVIGGGDDKYRRVVFNEITKKSIEDAFLQPRMLNIDRVNAQQSRRFLDRIVGFMLSPLLWKKVGRGLSAGRVQSVTVRMVVEREREIRSFVPTEYWEMFAHFKNDLLMQLTKYQNKALSLPSKEAVDDVLTQLKEVTYVVSDISKKPTKSSAPAPFITSTLQQAASTRLGFSVKRTMIIAQKLYEAGFITYMRTDSTHLSSQAIEEVRNYITRHYDSTYLPDNVKIHAKKKNAQEAHEAIRPSNVQVSVDDLKDFNKDEQKLYDLIWRQFVACQMSDAQYELTTIKVKANDYEFQTKGRVLIFDGWTKVLSAPKKQNNEMILLPALSIGERLSVKKVDTKQNFTKPVARFNEASLVKELEKRGIGRPSTYSSIISTIQERGYVHVENRRFFAKKIGEIVSDRLIENFNQLLSYNYTEQLEQELDLIADGKANWIERLNVFYIDFYNKLTRAELPVEDGGMKNNTVVMVDIDCPDCGRKMGIRNASTGVFLGCSGYMLPPKERCKKTLNLISTDEFEMASDEQEAKMLITQQRCQKCEYIMEGYIVDQHTKMYICGNNPICDGYHLEKGEFKLKGYDGPTIECDKCGADMELKTGRFGKYFSCTSDNCSNTRKVLKNGEPAPPKEDPIALPELKCTKSDAYFVLRDGAAGIFLAAHNFPKSRETRAPKIKELQQFKEKLHEKFKYLAKAPAFDPDGNEVVVKFSRKTKTQYVASEKEGKATGWTATYENDQWVPHSKKKNQ